MSNNKHRIFIGLQLSGYLISTIPMIKSTIKDKKQLIRWVSGKNLHLTLSFLGSVNEGTINDLILDTIHVSKSAVINGKISSKEMNSLYITGDKLNVIKPFETRYESRTLHPRL